MSRTKIVLGSASFVKIRPVNSTDTSFPSRIPTLTAPSGTGVLTLRRAGVSPQWLKIIPYGIGEANDVFEIMVVGWQKITESGVTQWLPQKLVKLICTMGAMTGVAASPVLATEKYCDTITASLGISNVSYQLFSPTDDSVGHALVSPQGCEKVELLFDLTTGDPTSANALVAQL